MLLLLVAVFVVTAGLIGWITNVLAVKMIFRPYEQIRLARVRFQGVLPKHIGQFADQLAGVMTSEIVTLKDMVQNLDPDGVFRTMTPFVDSVVDRVLADLSEHAAPEQRAILTPAMLAPFRAEAEREVRAHLPEMVDAIADRADRLVDMRALISAKLVAMGAKQVEKIIYEVSAREFRYIELYGGVFGALLGMLQFGFSQLTDIHAMLPLVGLIVGCVTNYLAIQMLFHPRQPRRVLFGFRYQGLFPKRQAEIASMMGHIAARDFVVPEDIFGMLVERVLPETVEEHHLDQFEELIGKRFPGVQMMITGMLRPDQHAVLRERLAFHYHEQRPALVRTISRAASEQTDIKAMLEDKVRSLGKSEFETLLRGLFAEEELYLVIYGGLLGALIGGIQLAVMGAAGW